MKKIKLREVKYYSRSHRLQDRIQIQSVQDFPMSCVSNLLPRSLLLWWVGIIYLLKIHSLGRYSDLTTVWGRAGWSGPKCPMTNPAELSPWDLTFGPAYHNKFSCPYLLAFLKLRPLDTNFSTANSTSPVELSLVRIQIHKHIVNWKFLNCVQLFVTP